LPFLLASALTLATPTDVGAFVGTGFKSTSRVAGTPSSMMLGVLQSNRENVLGALHGLQQQLSEIEVALISENFSQLESILNQSRSRYQTLIGN
jgi:prephenate dehydrogenase